MAEEKPVNIDDPQVLGEVIAHIEHEGECSDTTLAGRPVLQDAPALGKIPRTPEEQGRDNTFTSPVGGKRLDVTQLSIQQINFLMNHLPSMKRSGHRGVFHWIYEKTIGAYKRRRAVKALNSLPWFLAVRSAEFPDAVEEYVNKIRKAGTQAYLDYLDTVETRQGKKPEVPGNIAKGA